MQRQRNSAVFGKLWGIWIGFGLRWMVPVVAEMKGLHGGTLSIQAGGVFLGSLKGLGTCVCVRVHVCYL